MNFYNGKLMRKIFQRLTKLLDTTVEGLLLVATMFSVTGTWNPVTSTLKETSCPTSRAELATINPKDRQTPGAKFVCDLSSQIVMVNAKLEKVRK